MAARISEKQILELAPAAIAALFDLHPGTITTQASQGEAFDAALDVQGHRFAVKALGSASPGLIASSGGPLTLAARRLGRRTVPLLVVPFMNEVAQRACETAQIAWMDLSGNARMAAPGLRVMVHGRPDRFKGPGRPASIFAPKSARVARLLLMRPGRAYTQREIAWITDMTEGFVSRIAARLEQDRYIVREANGALRVSDPGLLLDSWQHEYCFDKHQMICGQVASGSGESLARLVSSTLVSAGLEHAATGLAAAWQETHYASFETVTFFVAEEPPLTLRDKLGFREDPRGANLWLVVPNDAGVFHGAAVRDGIRCVHPVQAFLDLKAHPERAVEAAKRLRQGMLGCG